MVQICITEDSCIDIYETDAFYAEISVFNSQYKIGPEYDLASLNRNVLQLLHDLSSFKEIQESQKLELLALQSDLLNCQLEESDF